MTCFWDGLISKLTLNEINKHLADRTLSSVPPAEFVNMLKARSAKSRPDDVLWNGQPLTDKLMQETAEWIAEYNVAKIGDGHDCSICDPFLIMICHIFMVCIEHNYLGHKITYTNTNGGRVLNFGSNNSHFSGC